MKCLCITAPVFQSKYNNMPMADKKMASVKSVLAKKTDSVLAGAVRVLDESHIADDLSSIRAFYLGSSAFMNKQRMKNKSVTSIFESENGDTRQLDSVYEETGLKNIRIMEQNFKNFTTRIPYGMNRVMLIKNIALFGDDFLKYVYSASNFITFENFLIIMSILYDRMSSSSREIIIEKFSPKNSKLCEKLENIINEYKKMMNNLFTEGEAGKKQEYENELKNLEKNDNLSSIEYMDKRKQIRSKIQSLYYTCQNKDDAALLMTQINEAKKARRYLLSQKHSLNDYSEILQKLEFISSLIMNIRISEAELCKVIEDIDQLSGNKIIRAHVDNILGLNSKPSVRNMFKLSKSKYLENIMKARPKCIENIRKLVNCLSKEDSSSVKTILDKLPHNVETKNIFKEYNIDYDIWTSDKLSPKEFVYKNQTYRVSKVDMDDISKALFMGDEVSCCTAMGRLFDNTAPLYIMNKCVQALEILNDKNETCGNTIIYFAKVKGRPALIVDNVIFAKKYSGKDAVKFQDTAIDAMTEYAKTLCKALEHPHMPIYAPSEKQGFNTSRFCKISDGITEIIGKSGEEGFYVDYITGTYHSGGRIFGFDELLDLRSTKQICKLYQNSIV